MVREDAGGGIDGHAEDLFRVVLGDFLDLHAALGAGHDQDAGRVAVDQQREVELAGDVTAGFDVDAADVAAGGAGLLGDQRVADHRLGGGADFLGGAGEADAALALGVILEMAGATAAGMYLAFHHIDRAGQFGGCGFGFLRGPGGEALQHADAVAA